MVHRARAAHTALVRRGVGEVEPAPRRTSRFPLVLSGGSEPERLLEKSTAGVRIGGEGMHGVEPLQGVVCGNLGVLGEQGRVVDRGHDETVCESLRVVERDPVLVAGDVPGGAEPTLPEVECGSRGDAPLNGVHHPRPRAAAPHAGILEEGDVAARAPLLVGVEEVIDQSGRPGCRLLHEPETEDAGVELTLPGASPVMHVT